jgi:hypothetical protein
VKECSKCKISKPEESFGFSSYVKKDGTRARNTWCKACYVATSVAYQKANPEKSKIWDRRKHYRRKYGISQSEYDAMSELQGGRCAICRQEETHKDRSGSITLLAVDHDHSTGQIRGLLCFNCNIGISKFSDNPELLEAAARYVSSYQD